MNSFDLESQNYSKVILMKDTQQGQTYSAHGLIMQPQQSLELTMSEHGLTATQSAATPGSMEQDLG